MRGRIRAIKYRGDEANKYFGSLVGRCPFAFCMLVNFLFVRLIVEVLIY